LVELRGILYKDETMGADYEVVGIDTLDAEDRDYAIESREKMVEAISETDDALLEKYLGGEAISIAELKVALRKAVLLGKLHPVVCGSAFKNKGVQPLLDAVVDLLPSPLDVPAIEGIDPGTEQMTSRRAADDEPFAGLIFKIMTDPYVGQLTFFRVYSGRVESGTSVLNAKKGTSDRIGRLLKMHDNKREEISEVWAGDIAAAVGLKNVTTGDTICDQKHPVVLEAMNFPEP